MLTKDSTDERDAPMYRFSANLSVALVIFSMIMCEVEAIPHLWMKGAQQDYGWNGYVLPLFIAFPGFLFLIFKPALKRWAVERKIESNLASRIASGFGTTVWLAYLCILLLAELAFRTR